MKDPTSPVSPVARFQREPGTYHCAPSWLPRFPIAVPKLPTVLRSASRGAPLQVHRGDSAGHPLDVRRGHDLSQCGSSGLPPPGVLLPSTAGNPTDVRMANYVVSGPVLPSFEPRLRTCMQASFSSLAIPSRHPQDAGAVRAADRTEGRVARHADGATLRLCTFQAVVQRSNLPTCKRHSLYTLHRAA
jgi:hypothetical protein